MSLADTPTFKKSKYDRFVSSGDVSDTMYLGSNFLGNSMQFGYSANNSRVRPVAKWLELTMKRLDEIAVAHNWIVTESGNSNIGPSGFNWYLYYGTNKVPFYPNSGSPYNLAGYNIHNTQLLQDIENNIQFTYDRCLDIFGRIDANFSTQHIDNKDNDSEVAEDPDPLNIYSSPGELPDSDTVYEYSNKIHEVSGWKNIVNNPYFYFGHPNYHLFDIEGSGYTLFTEYPPTSGAGLGNSLARINSKLHTAPYSGLYAQRSLTQRQGYTRPLNLYQRFAQYRSNLLNRSNRTVVHSFADFRTTYLTKTASISYNTTDLDFDSAKNLLQNEFANTNWTDSFSFNPDGIGSDLGVFIGNYHSLEKNPIIVTGTTVQLPQYVVYGGGGVAGVHYVTPMVESSDIDLSMTSTLVYGLCPVSNRAASILTIGNSGITHKLNDRFLNSISNSVQSRYGFASGDFNKLFYLKAIDDLYLNNTNVHAADNKGLNLTINSAGGASGYYTYLGSYPVFSYGSVYANIPFYNNTGFNHITNKYIVNYDDPYAAYNNHEIIYGDGCETVYGYIDFISEIDEYNILLLNNIGKDARDYYSNSNAYVFRGSRDSSFNVFYQGINKTNNPLSSGDLYYLYQNGKFVSDVIIEKINNNDYTQFCDLGLPTEALYRIPTETDKPYSAYDFIYDHFIGFGFNDFSIIYNWFSDLYDSAGFGLDYLPNYSGQREMGYIDFPFSKIIDVPPENSTHMWFACKAKDHTKNTFQPSYVDNVITDLYLYLYSHTYAGYNFFLGFDSLINGLPYITTPGNYTFSPQRIDVNGEIEFPYNELYIDGFVSYGGTIPQVTTQSQFASIGSGTITGDGPYNYLIHMKAVDNNSNESLMRYFADIHYITTPLGLTPHAPNNNPVWITDGEHYYGNIPSYLYASGTPERDYPVLCL